MRVLGCIVLLVLASVQGAQAAVSRTQHPAGFVFAHPPDWSVDVVDGMARAVSRDGSEFVAVGPVAVRPGQRAVDVLRAMAASGRLGPIHGPRLVALRDEGEVARGLLTVMDKKAQAMLALRGDAGTLYLMGAPADRFHARAPALVEVLRSFSLRPAAAGGAATPRLELVPLTEPRERAYSIALPAGWRTELGVHRVGALSPRFESSAVAPDGSATVFVGERSAGTYTVPTPLLAQLGVREGMVYDPSGAHPSPVLRYLPGEAFAAHWLGQRLPGARATGARPLPDLAQRLAAEQYRFGNAMGGRIHAGELDFEHRGQPGRVTVATEVFAPANGSQLWRVMFVAGWFAAPHHAAAVEDALARAVASVRVNPDWLRAERAFARLDHQRVMATLQATNDLYRQSMAQRAESSARNARRVGDTLAGTWRVLDPSTGESTTVQAGSNFYYRVDRTDTVVGSRQELGAVDLTRMLMIDWDPIPARR